MAEIDLAQFQGALNAEQKAFFEKHVSTASTAAVDKFKTDDADARKKLVPEKYEFKVVKDSPLDPKGDVEKIAAFAREQGLSNEQAQKYLELTHGLTSDVVSRQEQAALDRAEQWKTETWADKELGGDNKTATETNIKRVIDKFGALVPGFGKFVDEYGFGNNVEFVRMFNAIGKAMAEDRPHSLWSGGGGGKDKASAKSYAESLYGDKYDEKK